MDIKDLIKDVHTNAVEHGWWAESKRNFGELLMLCVSELAEALEEYRAGREVDEIYYIDDKDGNPKPEGIPTELADVVIRICDMCGYYNIDLAAVIEEKHIYNKGRPYKHGKKC